MLEHFARIGDERGLARSHMLAYYLHWLKARATPAGEELRLAAEHARKARDDGLRERALAAYVGTLRYGQAGCAHDLAGDSTRSSASSLARTSRPASKHARRSSVAGSTDASDEARRLVAAGGRRFRSLGNSETAAGYEQDAGQPGVVAGRPRCRARGAGAQRRHSRAPRRARAPIHHTGVPRTGPLAAGKRRRGQRGDRARRGAGRHRRRRNLIETHRVRAQTGARRRGRRGRRALGAKRGRPRVRDRRSRRPSQHASSTSRAS